MISSATKLVLLCAATSLLSQSAAAQAVVFPYNCDSIMCKTDCVTAVNNICTGAVGPLTTTQTTTVKGCTAKYVPYQGVADQKATCLAGFQKILHLSNAAAGICDGKTPGRIGGVLALDANNQVVKGTSYAIFPAQNNPNCVVNPSVTNQPIVAKNKILGTAYDCSAAHAASSPHINARSAQAAKCGVSIAGAALCSGGCALGVFCTIASFGIAGAATVAGCVLCTAGETYLVFEECYNKKGRRDWMLGGPIYERAVEPGYCAGNELNGLSLSILPVCLQPPFKSSCRTAQRETA